MNIQPSSGSLPRATPEALGLRSEGIRGFIEAVAREGVALHSFLVMRHGHIAAEAYWKPYRHDLKHTLYSLSKSFTSITVGIAEGNGLLSTGDRVVEILGDKVGGEDAHRDRMTIHDLLTMSAGHDAEPLPWPLNPPLKGDFVAGVLKEPVEHAPGSKFVYSNGAMMLLAECFRRKTGQNLSDYARIHLFAPLGITDFDWERFENGLDTGGWGLRLRSEDIMKFGLMLLRRGNWNGLQIAPAPYVDRATSALVSTAGRSTETPDWLLGYGYLFWQTAGGMVRGDGAMSQYLILSPKDDIAIVTTAEFNRMQQVLDLLRQYVLADIAAASDEFPKGQALVFSPELARPSGKGSMSQLAPLDGLQFSLAKNELGAKTATFSLGRDSVKVTLQTLHGAETVVAGFSSWITGPTGLSALPLHLASACAPECQFISGAAAVGDDGILSLEWRFPETAHAYRLQCTLTGADSTITVTSSICGMDASYPSLHQVLRARPMR